MAEVIWFTDARRKTQDEPGNRFPIIGTAHVYLDGQCITSLCYRVERYEDGTASAFCYVKDADGQFVLTEDNEDVVTEVRTGNIEVVPFESGMFVPN